MRSLARVTEGMKSRAGLKQVCCQGPAARMEFPSACSGVRGAERASVTSKGLGSPRRAVRVELGWAGA